MLQEDAGSNEQENKHKMQINNVKNEPNQLNKRLFKQLLHYKKHSSSPPRTPSSLTLSENLVNVAPDIPETDSRGRMVGYGQNYEQTHIQSTSNVRSTKHKQRSSQNLKVR